MKTQLYKLHREIDSLKSEIMELLNAPHDIDYFSQIRKRLDRLEEIDSILSSSPVVRETADKPSS